MNRYIFEEAIGNLDDKYISEALGFEKRHINRPGRWKLILCTTVAAASVLICITAAAGIKGWQKGIKPDAGTGAFQIVVQADEEVAMAPGVSFECGTYSILDACWGLSMSFKTNKDEYMDADIVLTTDDSGALIKFYNDAKGHTGIDDLVKEQTYKLGENIWWRPYDWLADYGKDEYRENFFEKSVIGVKFIVDGKCVDKREIEITFDKSVKSVGAYIGKLK